jgi:hypothetical protein
MARQVTTFNNELEYATPVSFELTVIASGKQAVLLTSALFMHATSSIRECFRSIWGSGFTSTRNGFALAWPVKLVSIGREGYARRQTIEALSKTFCEHLRPRLWLSSAKYRPGQHCSDVDDYYLEVGA